MDAESNWISCVFGGPLYPGLVLNKDGLATTKKAVDTTGNALVEGFSASEGIRDLLDTSSTRDGREVAGMWGRARGYDVGGMFPHLDMVTPNIIFTNFIFRKMGLRVLTRGRTAQDGDCD